MKNSERKFISKFTNDNLMIDKDFKMKLKNQILKQAKTTITQQRTIPWPRLVLAPVALSAVIVTALILLNGGGANNTSNNPLQPRKVSAAELLKQAEDYYKSVDPSKAEFYKSVRIFEQGPQFEACKVEGMGSGTHKEKTVNMAFNSSTTNTEASYDRIEDANGNVVAEVSRYDDTPAELDITIPREVSVPSFLEQYTSGGHKVVDVNGREIADEDTPIVERNGNKAYELYLKNNLSPTACGGIEILQVRLDARTYAVLQHNTYTRTVSPENLIVANTEETSYSSPGDEAALKAMSQVGFNMERVED